jgi:hypothetical protein
VDANTRYWAFLSYSHDDRHAAARLHRALETYRLPQRLVGRIGSVGTAVPERLFPVFRDREELTAGDGIGVAVERALAASRALLVLCSPAAAASRWVDAEIVRFAQLQPSAPILCVLLDGEPLSARECLPPALRARFRAGIGVDDIAPVAVDLRADGDGRRLALQKLVAGLAGVPLDQLVQRDAHRRHLRLAWLSAALAVIAFALGTMAVFAFKARDEARDQRAQAEGLIGFMLGDLRERLEPVGRLDALDSVGARALAYFDRQDPHKLDANALGQRSRALHMIGDLRDRRGDRAGALKAFQRAADTTAELLQRDPDNAQRIYDHAQSVFWVAYASDWQAGRSAAAEQAFLEYQRLARQLVAIDPDNLDWQAELAYAHSNLGTLMLEQGRTRDARAEFDASRRINTMRVARSHGDPVAVVDLGQDFSWTASALLQELRIPDAIATRRREIALYQQALQRDPRDSVMLGRLQLARRFLAEALLDSGDLAAAEAEAMTAEAAARTQLALEPDSTDWMQAEAKTLLLQAELSGWRGRAGEGLQRLERVHALLAQLLAHDPGAWAWKVELQEGLAQVESDLLRASGRSDEALQASSASVARLRDVMRQPERDKSRRWFVVAEGRLARLLDERGDTGAARVEWTQAATAGNGQALDAEAQLWLARADAATDADADASRLRAALAAAGYRNPEFHPRTGVAGAVASTSPGGNAQ